jgi:hypothetical protein
MQKRRIVITSIGLAIIVVVAGAASGWFKEQHEHLTYRLPPTLEQLPGDRRPAYLGGAGAVHPGGSPKATSTRLDKLSVATLFPGSVANIDVNGIHLRLRGARLDHRCRDATWAREFQDLLSSAGCSVAVRALYSGSQNRLAQLSVLRVTNSASAEMITETLIDRRISGFIRPLRNSSFRSQLGDRDGFSFIYHYDRDVVITWVQSSKASDYTNMALGLDKALLTSR